MYTYTYIHRGCFYNTSGTNSKHCDFMYSGLKIRTQPIPTELALIPNEKIWSSVHISSSFGISTVGINTRVIRAAPAYEFESGMAIHSCYIEGLNSTRRGVSPQLPFNFFLVGKSFYLKSPHLSYLPPCPGDTLSRGHLNKGCKPTP
jgi:hypothetical protein